MYTRAVLCIMEKTAPEVVMGKRSVKPNKNIYQLSREAAGLTREAAGDLLPFMSPDRIERIESEKSEVHPDEVIALAACYKDARLCHLYCTKECPIGKKYVPTADEKDLPLIALEVVNSLNLLEKEKNRLIEIALDSRVTKEEQPDFDRIFEELTRISESVQALKLWMEQKKLESSR